MELIEQTISSTPIYDGKVIKVYRDKVALDDGTITYRECIHHSGGATIVAEVNGEIYFVKQYRYPYHEVVLELPAGKLNEGEDPIACAERELTEETGLISTVMPLGIMYPSPGYTDEKIYMYYALSPTQGKTNWDEDERLDIVRIPTSQVKQMLQDGTILDAKTNIALTRYFDITQKKQ